MLGDGIYAYRCSDGDEARDGSPEARVVLWRYGGSLAVFWRR